MSKLKRPLTKNFYLSLTGKEPILNNFSLYNNFPIGLMIISKVDPTSCRDKDYFNDSEKDEIEIKIKYMNQQASDLFEIKENDSVQKIHEQLRQFKKFEKVENVNTTEETLDYILFIKDREEEFYGSFKNQATLIYVKYKIINEDYFICTDYYTEEKKLIQNQLFQSLKFQYIATLFHELYNPINALLFIIDDQNEDDNKEEFNYGNPNQNIFSDEGSHFSIITDNDIDKSNLQDNENSSIKKSRKIDEMYKTKLTTLHEKEKDISLLVNMIYIFLQNLILYLRINLGVNFIEKNETLQKEEKNIQNNKNINNNYEEQKIDESNSNDKQNNNIYTDKYLTHVNRNKKINLEISFYKHLNKFSYLFKFKNIHYCNDFSYLSDKYFLTDESIFFDFIGQIYSFLYYVVPKSQGFDISYSLINDNKLKILFQKTNFMNKGGLRFKKRSKNNSCILCEDKFKATSTVKTPEMTQEILYKLSEILGIKIKFMEYEDKKEDKYLTIIMPFVLDEDNDILDSDINELPEDNYGQIPYLEEVAERNILFDNNNKSENDNIKVAKTNEINKNNSLRVTTDNTSSSKCKTSIKNNNVKKKNTNNLNLNFYKISPERTRSFLVEEVEEKNSSEEDFSSKDDKKENENSNINNVNNNTNIMNNTNNNTNINNNINHSSLSKSSINNGGGVCIQSNSQKKPICKSKTPLSDKNCITKKMNNFKDLSSSYLNGTDNDNNNSKDILSKDIPNIKFTNVKIKRNALSVIHQKYSNLEQLKSRGVEILSENESENKKENDNKSLSEESFNESIDLKEKKSIKVEFDSDNFIEIENEEDEKEYEPNNNNNNKNEDINQNNSQNLNINMFNKRNNSVLLNLNYTGIGNNSSNNESMLKKNFSNKPSNKTLNFKSDNDSLFIIPEISGKKNRNGSPTLKLRKGLSSKMNTNNTNTCNCKDILLVDDDEFICKTFKNILKTFKLEADCAENGQECLNMIKAKQEKNCQCSKNKYKIILMDITMPVMDGIEAAKNIQKMIDENKLYDTVKIIFISAHVNLDLRTVLSGIKCAIDYYAKPISADRYKSILDKYYYPK